MKPTRRAVFQAGLAAGAGLAAPAAPLSAFDAARRHAIVRDLPTPNFFEGMLLGNGDVGVCVTIRPDAAGFHLGKSDSWDIRVSEDHYRHVVTFKELLEMWKRAGQEARRTGKPDTFLEREIGFFREYTEKVVSSYRKPWPRPWPCGIVWVHWDSRHVRLLRQSLDPAGGLLTVELEHDNLRGARRVFRLSAFVNQDANHLCAWTDKPAPFLSVAYQPWTEADAGLPPPQVELQQDGLACLQEFPATAPTAEQPAPPRSPKDSSFALRLTLAGSWKGELQGRRGFLQPAAALRQPFRLDVTLITPRDHGDNAGHAAREAARLAAVPPDTLRRQSEQWWRGFWSRSAVELADPELEQIWYHNQYWLACCLRQGKVCPGLFGNWTSGRIGTAWHGDYHMNYNTQQVFWGVFSSNHVEQHMPYVDLVEKLLPMSERHAREKFELPGAFFPHSAYPVPSDIMPYPAPPWGYEVCETPWTVQSLWWHYLYTQDRAFLERAYPALRAAARFLAAYASKGSDGRYHIVPSVSPENWGFTTGFRLNRDCIIDLALAEFALDAAAEASRILGLDAGERERWLDISRLMAHYPVVSGPHGSVWTDVADGPVEHVYNVPVTLAPVFPAERVGLGLREDMLPLARDTARAVRLEGGNDLVYLPLIRARLGILDLEWFKREVRYSRLPNGVAQDRVRQTGGRYRDSTDFDFMMRMGIWTENLSLPGVLNECLLQSYTGVIRLFPNSQGLPPARFRDLRAAGAFLVSAAWDGKTVTFASLLSEKGCRARVLNPWPRQLRVIAAGREVPAESAAGIVSFDTRAGETYALA